MALPLSYNWRNVLARKLNAGLTFLVVAMVVLVLAVMLSYISGIRATLVTTGNPLNLVVLKPGATAESTSIIQAEESNRLVQTPGIARDASSVLLLSPEISVQTGVTRRDGGTANMAVRGVDPPAFNVHSDVRIVTGRVFSEGLAEAIVGKAAQQRCAGLEIGDEVAMGRSGNRPFKIVGVFEAGGGPLESEIWAARSIITDSFARRLISSVTLRMTDANSLAPAIAYIRGPAVQLDAKSETAYYADLAGKTREIAALTTVLVTIMAIGAAFAVANTMYAAVDSRRREIAMLRTLGFSRRAIVGAFVLESLLICTLAWATGMAASLAVLAIKGGREDFLSDTTWTVLAYQMRITPTVALLAFALAVLVGVFGALAPALRASRVAIIDALRNA